ncbi:hypothetical protein [Paenibacillus polymyxa]|uniref:hypothetical protein n=1 Tax=Paenibacillus polymyxa TaxID=1406 RepID=UPI0020360394|nr:hypothetical protein [Paenibacillus polymyxa]
MRIFLFFSCLMLAAGAVLGITMYRSSAQLREANGLKYLYTLGTREENGTNTYFYVVDGAARLLYSSAHNKKAARQGRDYGVYPPFPDTACGFNFVVPLRMASPKAA